MGGERDETRHFDRDTGERSEGREACDLLSAELEIEDVEVLLVRVRVRL